jgi:hypothetical protein
VVQLSVAWSSITPQLEKCIGGNPLHNARRKLSINSGGIGGPLKANANAVAGRIMMFLVAALTHLAGAAI